MDLARRTGSAAIYVNGSVNAALVAFRVGEWTWAQQAMDRQLEDVMDPTDRAGVLAAWGVIASSKGEDVTATRLEIEAGYAGVTDRQTISERDSALAWCALAAAGHPRPGARLR